MQIFSLDQSDQFDARTHLHLNWATF